MTLEDLIRRFRVLADDKEQPVFWPDEVVTDWLNDAQAQACVRGRLLREDANPVVCQIALTPGQHTYRLHPSIYELIHLRIEGAGTERPRTMHLRSREWLSENEPGWRTLDEPSCWAIQDDTTLRVVGAIKAGEVLHLECQRLPLKRLANDMDKPEIHAAHHEHLIDWALFKAFSVPDADAFDPQRAKQAEDVFTAYFGRQPDSDMRRITREDVAHHNVAILP